MDNLNLDTAYLNITSDCNLRCRYCYLCAGTTHEEMATVEVVMALDALARLRLGKIVITGGEPLLHGGIRAISEHAEEIGKDVRVCINTNGTLMNDETAAMLVRCYHEVRISIDGVEEHNDSLRGSGTFDRIIRAFRRIRVAGGNPIASVTVCDSNLTHIPVLLRYLWMSGITDVRLTPMRYAGRAEENFIAWSHARLHSLLSHMLVKEMGMDMPADGDDINRCDSSGFINIMPDGWVYPCHLLTGPEYRLGSIMEEEPENIIARMKAFRHMCSIGPARIPAFCPGYAEEIQESRFKDDACHIMDS